MLLSYSVSVIRTLSTIIFLVMFGIFGSSQTTTFNKRYILYDSLRDERFLQVIPTQQGFLVAGLSDKSQSDDYNRLVFISIDSAGNILSKKIYGDSTHNYWLPDYRTIIPTTDSMYMMALSYQTSFDRFTILMKLNALGDTLWTRKINFDPYYGVIPNELIQTDDGGYAIAGKYWDEGCLQKLDSNCNTQWYKIFGATGNYYYSELWSVHELPEGGYAIGYLTNYRTNAGCFVSRLDTAGNPIWEHWLSGYWLNDIIKVDLISDSTILGVATHPSSDYYPDKKNIEVQAWSLNGNQVTTNYLGPGKKICYHDLDKLSDSTYVVSGHTWDDNSSGWWMIINSRGQKILYKAFTYPYESRGFYGSVGTPDGGILSVGENKRNGRTDYDPWILKTDIYGCLTPGCDPDGIYIVSQPVSKDICTMDTATFQILANDDTSSTISRFNRIWQQKVGENWIPLENNEQFQGVTTDTLSVINAKGMSGIYYVRCLVWNNKYYLASQTVTLKVKQNAQILKQPVNQYIAVTEAAIFRVNVDGEEPITYQWYFNEDEIPGATSNVYRRFPVEYGDQSVPFSCRIVNPCDYLFSESAYIFIKSTGIDSLSNEKTIRVYPVPSNNIICINIPSYPTSHKTFTFIDLTGQAVLTDQSESQKTCIPVHGLDKGLYLLKISCNETDSYRKVIVE
jgi:hypothetical protein